MLPTAGLPAGSESVQEESSPAARHALVGFTRPTEPQLFLDAALGLGRLRVVASAALDLLQVTLDGQEVARLTGPLLSMSSKEGSTVYAPDLTLGERTVRMPYRRTGSALRPWARQTVLDVGLEPGWCVSCDGTRLRLHRGRDHTSEPVATVAYPDSAPHRTHLLTWSDGVTVEELVLLETLYFGVDRDNFAGLLLQLLGGNG